MEHSEQKEITGRVHSLETFGLVDGPGVRFVIFLQGCHMRCQFCHNPETWNMEGGQAYTARQLFEKACRNEPGLLEIFFNNRFSCHFSFFITKYTDTIGQINDGVYEYH